eukprot:6054955-Prymnesium_polylepis.1
MDRLRPRISRTKRRVCRNTHDATHMARHAHRFSQRPLSTCTSPSVPARRHPLWLKGLSTCSQHAARQSAHIAPRPVQLTRIKHVRLTDRPCTSESAYGACKCAHSRWLPLKHACFTREATLTRRPS